MNTNSGLMDTYNSEVHLLDGRLLFLQLLFPLLFISNFTSPFLLIKNIQVYFKYGRRVQNLLTVFIYRKHTCSFPQKFLNHHSEPISGSNMQRSGEKNDTCTHVCVCMTAHCAYKHTHYELEALSPNSNKDGSGGQQNSHSAECIVKPHQCV